MFELRSWSMLSGHSAREPHFGAYMRRSFQSGQKKTELETSRNSASEPTTRENETHEQPNNNKLLHVAQAKQAAAAAAAAAAPAAAAAATV